MDGKFYSQLFYFLNNTCYINETNFIFYPY